MAVDAPEAALTFLEEAIAARELNALWIGRDPRFESLHGDGRFAGLLERLRHQAGA